MRHTFHIILLLLPSILYAQKTTIKGNVLDYDTGKSLVGIAVYIDNNNGTITDQKGEFYLKAQTIKSSDKLKIGFINYYEIVFINLTNSVGTLELKNIPLFYYFPDELNPISIFCKRFDLICMWRRRKQMKEEVKRLEPYYNERKKIIKNYKYTFRGHDYSINVDKHIIDLKMK